VSEEGKIADAFIRRRFVRQPPADQEPSRTRGFDGGVRQPPPAPGPSADSLLRAMARVPRGDVLEAARNFDALRPPGRNDNY
jgi:hypothetical protein